MLSLVSGDVRKFIAQDLHPEAIANSCLPLSLQLYDLKNLQ